MHVDRKLSFSTLARRYRPELEFAANYDVTLVNQFETAPPSLVVATESPRFASVLTFIICCL